MERIRKADGTALRAAREDAWLTQKELAEVAGVAEWTISQIETGHIKSPRMNTLKVLAKALGVHPDSLLENAESNGNGPLEQASYMIEDVLGDLQPSQPADGAS